MKKAELQAYLTGYCKHRNPYQHHPNCFRNEILNNLRPIKRGFLDIEFMNFKANYGCILTYAIKEESKNKYYTGMLNKEKDLDNYTFDKRLVKNLIDDINKFDEIITFYGTRCDIPYIRTRALKFKLDFPFYGFVKHKDVYYIAKFKMSLSSNSLESVCQLLGIKGKNHMNPDLLFKGLLGHTKSLDKIMEHNLRDVRITEKAYHKLILYARRTQRSL